MDEVLEEVTSDLTIEQGNGCGYNLEMGKKETTRAR